MTTSLISQIFLMLAGINMLTCQFYESDRETAMYVCLFILVSTTHYMYLFTLAVYERPKILNYGPMLVILGSFLTVANALFLATKLPHFRMHNMWAIGLMFAGELIGTTVYVVDAIIQALAGNVEKCLS